MDKTSIEILVFDGCPHLDLALARAQAAVAKINAIAEVEIVRVATQEQAQRLRFLGSPTVRVRGADVESAAAYRMQFGLQCRVYSVDGHFEGAPPIDWIVSALRTAT